MPPPGTSGCFDQVMVVNWVRDNIRQFNGNPELITLFGPGAGGASAGLLALSPLTRRHIKRVIAQSGSPVADWATVSDFKTIRNMSIVAGAAYGCRTRHTFKLVQCLKTRSPGDVIQYEVQPDIGWLPWAPVLDWATRSTNQFLPETPEAILTKGFPPEEAHIDGYMSGVTRDEGSVFLQEDAELANNGFIVTQPFFRKKVAQFIKIYNSTLNPDALISAVKFMYTPWTDSQNLSLVRKGLVDVSFN